MRSVMVDIETLGLNPGCPILSIGAVVFDPLINFVSKEDRFHTWVRPSYSVFEGFKIDADTLRWWLQKDPEFLAECEAVGGNTYNALIQFNNWVATQKVNHIWANDPSFDIAIINQAARTILGSPLSSFNYKGERSFRTIVALGIELGIVAPERREDLKKHNALSDAIAQAEEVTYIISQISNYKSLATLPL